jgi:hypothetical protein
MAGDDVETPPLAPEAAPEPRPAPGRRPLGAPPLLRADLCPSPEACCEEACCYLDWMIDRGDAGR